MTDSTKREKPGGVAKVTVTEDGEVVYRDAIVLWDNRVLSEFTIPLRYGAGFSDHEVRLVVTFEPPVRPYAGPIKSDSDASNQERPS